MELATLDNVIATVSGGSHNVALTIDEDGLVVGPFGKMPWAGSEMTADVVGDGCEIRLIAAGVDTRYFVPASSFVSLGGARVIKPFATFLVRAAVAAGAQVLQPVA